MSFFQYKFLSIYLTVNKKHYLFMCLLKPYLSVLGTHILKKNSLYSQLRKLHEPPKEPFHYFFNWNHYFLQLTWGLLSMALSPWMADRRAQLCNVTKFFLSLYPFVALTLADVVASTLSV